MAKTVKIRLGGPMPPDTCAECPLCGLIPDTLRQKGRRQRYCCLGVRDGYYYSPLTSKGIYTSAEAKRAGGHLLHRPCDDRWEIWWKQNGLFPLQKEAYQFYRQPFETELKLKLEPELKFRAYRK